MVRDGVALESSRLCFWMKAPEPQEEGRYEMKGRGTPSEKKHISAAFLRHEI